MWRPRTGDNLAYYSLVPVTTGFGLDRDAKACGRLTEGEAADPHRTVLLSMSCDGPGLMGGYSTITFAVSSRYANHRLEPATAHITIQRDTLSGYAGMGSGSDQVSPLLPIRLESCNGGYGHGGPAMGAPPAGP